MNTDITSQQLAEQALSQAVSLHQAGKLEEAGQQYQSIIEAYPNHPVANHNMGVLAVQMQQVAAGLQYLLTALEADPTHGQYWLSYIDALIKAGQLKAAREVMGVAHAQGLAGDEVEVLAEQLRDAEQLETQQDSARSSQQESQPSARESKNSKQGKASKKKEPAHSDVDALLGNFKAGRLDEAERSARAMTLDYPRHDLGWMVLGVVLKQNGRHAEALDALQKAVALSPNNPDAYNNLGITFKAMGRLDEAVASYRRALEIRQDMAEVHYNLANALKDKGRLDEAEVSYRRAIKFRPHYPEALNNLGNILRSQERLSEAEECYRRTLELMPDAADALSNLGFVLLSLDRLDEAESNCRRALEINPDFAEAYNNLGITLRKQERREEAEASFMQALRIEPDFAEAHNNLGITLVGLGRVDEAAACYRRALQINPEFAEAHSNLGSILLDQGHAEEAEASFRLALQLKPDLAEAYSHLGLTLKEQGRRMEAEASCRRALEIKPDFARGHSVLGCIYQDWGRLEEAQSCFRQALEIKPDHFSSHNNLLFSLNYTLSYPPAYCFAEAQRFGEKVAQKVSVRFAEWLGPKQPKRLRVGFVSGDFRRHPVGYFIENLLAHIDQDSMELVAYPTDPKVDELTARIKPYFSEWHSLCGLSDEAAARRIHSDGVHVLIDLSGHTSCNRLPVFAWKPAPVQASWLGYLNTTGLDTMDYFIADPWTLPETEEAYFTEKIFRLPESYLCFTPPDVDVQVAELPALKNGYITFGSFNNLTKLNDDVVAVWSRVLASVPDSRLFLKTQQLKDASVRQQVIERFAAHGIDGQRLILDGPVQRVEHFEAFNRMDIALDPFPYPGITTSVEGLWMGVPLLTMAGERFISRQGVGLMMNAGLPDWVARDADDYVARAVLLAGDLQYLSSLRSSLRQRVLASPIFDADRFARNFEAALWAMWKQTSEGAVERVAAQPQQRPA